MKIFTVSLLAIALVPVLGQAGNDSAPVRLCRNHLQAKIDVVDAEMRKGHDAQVEKLIKRRDKLRGQYKACDSNPDAYKKDI